MSGHVLKTPSSGRSSAAGSPTKSLNTGSGGFITTQFETDSSLRKIFRSNESLNRENSTVEPCSEITKIREKCPPMCDHLKLNAPSGEPLTPALSTAREIVEEVVQGATRAKPRRRLKKPQMKSGWMSLDKTIPNFNINDNIFKNIMFNENLLVSTFESNSLSPTPVGALSLDVQEARGGPLKYQKTKTKSDFLAPKFLVHLSSQLDFCGYNGGSRITAWVDQNLQTLEEKRREYVQMDDGLDQQALYVSSQENFYYLRHDKRKDIFYSPKKARNLICEGANFVLMRYLAITKFVGFFETTTLYINGSLCRNIYECKGPSSGIINDKKVDVCKIYRTIVEECGIKHKSITLMTLTGKILKQEWYFCNYILQLNPLIELGAYDRIPLERKPLHDDIQLLSLYLDAKMMSKKHIANYLDDQPEVREMISDYVQTILHLKPEDVFEFTAKYFLAFTPALLPQSEYFEEPFDEDHDEDYDFWKYI
ncbi:ciliogenesis-associated TTC17-interacting protein-like [Tribolium madens]|uniref:ciliogenesis-associated TTC17-interacting protein-like n=1 Tax=Tribolium madens TaxID=41895 RepID=UPI001CF73B54|nr:ciliogenesis-associated TTC17-interacting protein-like [Tribolium madens]